ncbi:hypothetical protein TrRE_jg12667, partial [Triparma retinervis]
MLGTSCVKKSSKKREIYDDRRNGNTVKKAAGVHSLEDVRVKREAKRQAKKERKLREFYSDNAEQQLFKSKRNRSRGRRDRSVGEPRQPPPSPPSNADIITSIATVYPSSPPIRSSSLFSNLPSNTTNGSDMGSVSSCSSRSCRVCRGSCHGNHNGPAGAGKE